MDERLLSELNSLSLNHEEVTGKTFRHFLCPILFKDEQVPLCKAHIINQAFDQSSRALTVQRKDVDSFYGSAFESDFVDLRYRELWNPTDVIGNRSLTRKFKPTIRKDGVPVEYYIPKDTVPKQFTEVLFSGSTNDVKVVLKINSDEMLRATTSKWEIDFPHKDVRLAALVSLISFCP